MNTIRKFFGIIWVLLAPAVIIFIIYNAIAVLNKLNSTVTAATTDAARAAAEAARTNGVLQWSIIVIIFIPIAFGLIVFGKYAFRGEYDR